MRKKRIVVVCPGRGSYTKENLNSLKDRRHFQSELTQLDQLRKRDGYPKISELDQSETFKVSLHTLGEHASTLIYACSFADFKEINLDQYEVVAITGNSMGWYLALSMAQVLNFEESYQLIQTMGSQMKDQLIGGQIIYPIINDSWQRDEEVSKKLDKILFDWNQRNTEKIYISIRLGGYLVLAGEQKALTEFMKLLPKKENYPFQLVNHGAFHTPLLESISQKAQKNLTNLNFKSPSLPMIDGRGVIWTTYSSDPEKLYDYTLGHQVTETYDFSLAMKVALKEFSPDHIVLLGPGNSLGGALGQTLIENQWRGIKNKDDFISLQKINPYLLSMALPEQKKLLL